MPDPVQELIESPAALDAYCTRLAAHPVFGLDTEFIGENSFHPQLCLVQVATPDHLTLIDPFACGPLDSFWQLVVDPARCVVVHAGREEIRIVRHAGGQPPGNLFDVQIAAGLVGVGYPMGHAALVQQLLGITLQKGETLTDWSRRPLTDHQVRYAFDDVRFLLRLHAKLDGKLARLGRGDWATEEFAALTRRALSEDPEIERWRKLRGLGSLDRKKLAIVRELYAWRESVAERQNRPSRTVLRDDLIVEVAKRAPRNERDLAVLRGLPNREHAAILEAVRRGRETPADALPAATERDNDPPQVGMVTSFLMSLLGDLCARWKITPGMVATNYDVKALVRAHFQQSDEVADDSALTRGWRSRHVLPVVRDILEGRQGVRVGDVRRTTPFAWDGDVPLAVADDV